MNKKLFLGMFAAASMLLATSCSNDELDVVQSGNEAQVTFSLAAEGGIETRAISDGKSADLLYYAIFDADGKLITTINGSTDGLLKKEDAFPNGSKKDEVTVTLAKGQEYTAVFWAQDEDCKAYTVTAETDGLKIAVDYEGNNNDETRDAFFKAETFKVTGNAKIDVELKRPFAQINVGVTKADWNAAVESGVEITESKVVIKNAANKINLLDGTVSGEEEVTYDFATIPAKFTPVETLEVDVNRNGAIQEEEKYVYLSMSYILTSAERTTLESDGLQFTFKSGGEPIVFDEGLHQVPVQRNWRTNILGKLLTGDIQFNIVIDERFDDDYNYPDFEEVTNGVKYDAATKTYYLYSANGLKWVSEQSNSNTFNGYTIKLSSDVDLTNVSWTPIGNSSKHFQGIFDGQNHVISNLTTTAPANADTEYAAGLFGWVHYGGTVKNVKMTNVNVNSIHYAGAVVGYIYGIVENCHVDGGTVTSTVKNSDNGNSVGGIAGYVAEESLTSGSAVKDCSVNGLTVTAYRDVAGLVGTANIGVVVENNRVSNTIVIADQLCEYKEEKPANAAEIVGRNIATADLTSNTTNNVTVTIYGIDNGIATVGTDAGVTYAINKGVTTINLKDGNYNATKLTSIAGKTLTFIGDGPNTIFDYSSQRYGEYVNGGSGNFTFKNMTINRSTETFAGMAHTASTTYEECTIKGTYYVYETTAKFTKCKFEVTGNFYNCWLYGTSTTTYTECTFNCSGKSIYVDGNGETGSDLTADTCIFNDKGGVEKKAAIETGNTYGQRYSLTINNTTVNGFSTTDAKSSPVEGAELGTNVWGNKNYMTKDKLSVTIDGVKVY